MFGILFTLKASSRTQKPEKTRFTIFIRIIYIARVGSVTAILPILQSNYLKRDVIKKNKNDSC